MFRIFKGTEVVCFYTEGFLIINSTKGELEGKKQNSEIDKKMAKINYLIQRLKQKQ